MLGYAVLLTAFCFAGSHVDFNVEQLLVRKAIEDGIKKVLYLRYSGFSLQNASLSFDLNALTETLWYCCPKVVAAILGIVARKQQTSDRTVFYWNPNYYMWTYFCCKI